jgi:hypothetical protein
MKPNELIVAHAQVWLFFLALAGFVGLMFELVGGAAKLDSTTEKLVYTMLGVFGTILTQMAGYFFSRQRPDGTPPNPIPTQVK